MPIYDYRCSTCGREVEIMHGIHDRGPETCGACGGAMRKALSPPAIHFKGSGWAKKDAASTKPSPKPAKGTEASQPGADTATSNAEKKDAAAPRPASTGAASD